MKVDVVVDVGNTRIKWGRCGAKGVAATASLVYNAPASWKQQLQAWKLAGRLTWAVSGVQPEQRDRLVQWLDKRGDTVVLIDSYRQLPLQVEVDVPEQVGIDRLLNAVAANSRLDRARQRGKSKPAVIVDAGTAVTVNLLSPEGVFQGGAILPGRRLMATALHQHTAQLPMVWAHDPELSPLGKTTQQAIEAGVHFAVFGAVQNLVSLQPHLYYPRDKYPGKPTVFVTGGDGPFVNYFVPGTRYWPEMTLEGLRLTAEAQPG